MVVEFQKLAVMEKGSERMMVAEKLEEMGVGVGKVVGGTVAASELGLWIGAEAEEAEGEMPDLSNRRAKRGTSSFLSVLPWPLQVDGVVQQRKVGRSGFR